MIKPIKTGWAVITLFGMVAGAANADDAGIYRVSDTPAQSSAPAATPAPAGSNGVVSDASYDGTCDDGGGHRCYCPTRGFHPPTIAPVYRDAVVYYHYWPAKWYGQPGWNLQPQFPQIYMPTDTTQLGFYYQRVPQWLPNPAMYPPAPRPSDWHRRVSYTDELSCNANAGMVVTTTPSSPTPAAVPTPANGPAPAAPPPPSATNDSQEPTAAMQYGMPQQTAAAPAPRRWLIQDIADFFRPHSDNNVYYSTAPSYIPAGSAEQTPAVAPVAAENAVVPPAPAAAATP
jgi:hypothetical protein